MSIRRSHIIGCGSYLPSRILTNRELAEKVDTTEEWIIQRTGINQRHIAAEDERCSDLAIAAASIALKHSGVTADDIDLIVLATTTPDQTFPATAVRVQAGLGMQQGVAFDVQAVCSGFIFAISIADNFIRLGQAGRALVIGADIYSRILDWKDRGTCVLFGDGAGAVVLEGAIGEGTGQDRGILSTHLHTDGRHQELLYVDGGVSSTGTVGHLRMIGREVFKYAVARLAEVAEEALQANGLTIADIRWLIPHQANRRIIDATAHKLDIDPDRVVVTVGQHANTSAASVPLAMDVAVRDGRIQSGDLMLIEAMGGGFSWGSALVRW
jgi:3-oxoacyl-[acyl-carrier-protein] synthase-3